MLTRSMVLCLLLLAMPSAADERPAIGARVPLPVLRDLAGAERPLTKLAGPRGIALVFWAAWSDRSVEQLRRIDAVASEIGAHGVGVAAINVERHTMGERDLAALREQVKRLGVRVPVLIDHGLELFHAYGVVTVPSTALVDARGTLVYFLYGYSYEEREELFDALDRLAGIARRRGGERSTAVPAAIRRLQFGRVQLAQGRAVPARRSFEQAAEADPAFVDPLVELAALALDDQDLARGRELLERASRLQPSDRAVRREQARLVLIEHGAAAAVTALRELGANGVDPVAAAYLGYVLHAAGDAGGAQAAFERARQITGTDPRTRIGEVPDSLAGARRAMTAFRREVAVRKP